MATIDINGLSKSYGDVAVLHDLDLRAADGEFVTLLGPSGCGKTTTLRCLAGLEHPDAGRISVGGRVVAAPREKVFVPPNRRSIGMVFQSYALWPHMTVFANVAYPLRRRRPGGLDPRTAVMEILATVGMDGYAHRQVTDLSGGQQQRVALARAMVARPELLLFDEPLSNLDAKLRRTMRREIRAAHDASGATSLYVTHDQEEAITLSDRVIVLREGTVQQVGTPQEIYRTPGNRFVADFVGFDNILRTTLDRRGPEGATLRLAGVDGSVAAALGETAAAATEVAVAIRAEHVRIAPVGALSLDGPGTLRGQVQSRTYTGEHFEYVVTVGAQALLVRSEDVASLAGLEAGAAVDVRLDPAHCVVVADDVPSTPTLASVG
jgi:iron(III) transport system ATP-binding protein